MNPNLFTMIARVADSMFLVETMDNFESLEEMRYHGKEIIRSLTLSSTSVCTIDVTSSLSFHYVIEDGIVYLCLTEKGYPKKLAFQYLETLSRAFHQEHGHEVHAFSRPYAAVDFEPQMSRVRKEFIDPQAPGNIKKLASELNDISNIMSQSINQVLQRGEKLNKLEQGASNLLSASRKFETTSKRINLQAQLKQLAPVLAVLLVIIFVIYWKFF